MLDDILHDSYYGMISGMAWDPTKTGPYSHLAVGPLTVSNTPYCSPGDVPVDGLDGYLDHYQIWSSLAYAYELTSNPLFLTYAAKMTGTGDIRVDLEGDGLNNLGNRAALLALAQDEL